MSPSTAPRSLLRIVCICWLLCSACLAPAQTSSEDISVNFVNVDIPTVIRAMSKITHRNFVVDQRVQGTLSIVTNTPVSKDIAYQMLLSALRLQGYTVIEGRGMTEVLPEADAKLHMTPVITGGKTHGGDRMATRIFAIKNESAAQLVQVIRPLVSPNNTVTAYANNNTLVVTDYAENLQRIARIIESIDVPQSDVVVIPIQYASAVDLAATANRLLGNLPAGGDSSQQITIIADERVNALLVRSDNPSRINSVRQLIKRLDQPSLMGNVHVIYLKNAEAGPLAQTLRGILSGEISETAATSHPSLNQGGGTSLGTSASITGSTGSMTGSATRTATQSPSSKATGNNSMIQADPVTNSLIITAPDAVYNNIRQVVDKLDRRRAQVYVEALIAEISADRAAEFGIQWQSSPPPSNGSKTFLGGTNFTTNSSNILNFTQNTQSASQGLNLAFGGVTTFMGKEILNLNMLARALESETKTNILSTPNLIMLDNEEAKILVGQSVPFVTGSYSATGGTTALNPFQTYTRQDVGLTLKIKPQISEGGTLRLQIYQESSSVVASTANNTSGPTTTKRSLETTALVDDGAIIALGGMVQDSYSSGMDKVPMLGDIPVLGSLFKYDSRQRTKTNLVIFLRPKILRSADSYQNLTADRYDYVIGQQKKLDSPDRLMRNEASAPQLPKWPDTVPAISASTLPAQALPPVAEQTPPQ
jgi:general secretion pathway protein D